MSHIAVAPLVIDFSEFEAQMNRFCRIRSGCLAAHNNCSSRPSCSAGKHEVLLSVRSAGDGATGAFYRIIIDLSAVRR